MKPVSADEMRLLDETAIKDYCFPSLVLMENAGRGISEIIARAHKPCRVVVIAGKGNNGGDGFVTARYLSNLGFQVRVLTLGDPASLKEESAINYRIIEKMKIPIRGMSKDFSEENVVHFISDGELIVDAIFGTGLRRDLHGVFDVAVKGILAARRSVISIDIPSGIDSDSGRVCGVAVRASITATLGLPKIGLLMGQGPEYAGKVEVVDIGMPRILLAPYLD